ncbi:uncharacterized protein LOC126188566 [Schistocerca cancellata]|uniref:uncharacterized protein LOC126188566 n=1 Tax=Schistocerca cancellata TaxID=274614 RepID=UPI0021174C22|nr:uncharacterized protein LOC126188566 [Schistocerca cancellata]
MDELSKFILEQKNLIYEEKKKLNLIPIASPRSAISSDDAKSDRKMVRYGEYSPLNPTCRTSSKLLLGIGEYDERKRLLEEKKKQEHKQVRPARKECSQPSSMQNYIAPAAPKFSSSVADKSVQVECDAANDQNKLRRTYVDQCVQVTEPPAVDIRDDLLKDDYGIPYKSNQKRKYIGGLHDLEVAADEKLSLNIEDSTVKNSIDFSMLSPRDRRLMEFCGSGSYNPSFYEKWKSPTRTVAEKDAGLAAEHIDGHMATEQLRKRTYQEELRKQIEEKRQLEAQQREKERREEEIILKRVEQQQLRMKLEFEREQAQRRHKVEKRMHQFESCKSSNELDNCTLKSSRSNNENHTKYESSLPTKIEKIKHLPQGVTDNADFSNECDSAFNIIADNNNGNYLSVLEVCQTQDLSNNTGDGSKYKKNERPCWTERNCAPGATVSDITHVPDNLGCIKQNSSQETSTGPSETSVEDSCQFSLAKLSFNPEISSHVRKDTETAQRKRPVPTPRTKSLSNSSRTVSNSAPKLPSDQSQIHSTAVTADKENLNDSLPIPILEEANSFGYDSSETPGTDRVKSGALLRTEAKWKIPAVQKNIIQAGDSCRDKYHGRILTQLGAFRKQLQLDQLRMEEKVKIVRTQSDA